MKKIALLSILSFFILSLNTFVWAEDEWSGGPSVKEVVEDAVWIRPLGVIRIILEAPAFIISLPVTIPFKKVAPAYEFLIQDPFSFTFERPLGEM